MPARKNLTARRTSALVRQAAHDALSLDERLAKARSRRGKSQREITRLNSLHNH